MDIWGSVLCVDEASFMTDHPFMWVGDGYTGCQSIIFCTEQFAEIFLEWKTQFLLKYLI